MSPTHPDTFYAQTKRAAEQIVLNAKGADGQPLGAVLRLGAVYGSRIKGNYERRTRALAGNRFIPIGNGLNRRTLVYDKDVGRKPPRFSLPVGPVRFAAGVLEDGARLFGHNSPVNRSTIDKYTEDVAVESKRIREELGFVPQYDLRAGWEETIREMQF